MLYRIESRDNCEERWFPIIVFNVAGVKIPATGLSLANAEELLSLCQALVGHRYQYRMVDEEPKTYRIETSGVDTNNWGPVKTCIVDDIKLSTTGLGKFDAERMIKACEILLGHLYKYRLVEE